MFALFSGGHDSLCATHLASEHPRFHSVVHVNTGIGIEETREYVRQTCADRGWSLIEMHPDGKSYEDLVMDKGFPCGPQSHNTTYYWLKQRSIRRLVQEHKRDYKDRIGLVTGIRVNESERRMGSGISVPVRCEGAKVWINPILDWTNRDKNAYMEAHDLPRNQVVDTLHRSGECVCGALARREELREIEAWYPETAERIHALERKAKAAGLDDHFWAMRSPVSAHQLDFDLPLCHSCEQGVAA